MRHCFEFFWPRADVRVYSEAKRLVDLKLARSALEFTGRRRRTIYSITPRGRKALGSWLGQVPKPIALEFEALVKTFLGGLGSRADLEQTLAKTLNDARFMLEVATNVRAAYLSRRAPFQDEYVQVWQFVYDFLTDYFALVHDWAERTLDVVRRWPDVGPEGKREAAIQRFRSKRPARRLREAPVRSSAVPGTWQGGRARPRVTG